MNEETIKTLTDWLIEPGNNFCALPYVNLAIESNGDVRQCCMAAPLKDNLGNSVNINNEKSINNAFSHPSRLDLIKSFDENKQHSSCEMCWKDKSAYSPRVLFSAGIFGKFLTSDVYFNKKKPTSKLEYLEIKAGNRCNLKCRICGYWNSSQWTVDTHNYHNTKYNETTHIKDSFFYRYNKQAEWIDDINFWKNIEGLEDLKAIHMLGGEPFIIPEHFEMLDELSKKGYAKNIILGYNTNVTTKLTSEQIDILKNFKELYLNLSIDDVGKRFEYQRKNAVWEETINVVDWLLDLKKSNALPNLNLIIQPALSIYNVLYLEDIVEFAKYKNIDIDPKYVPQGINCAKTLHPDIKEVIVEKYKNSKFKDEGMIKNALEFLKDDKWSEQLDIERKDKTMFLDNARREKFTEVFPEMAKLLNYE